MDITVRVRKVIITDVETGHRFTVHTVRTAEDIASYVEEIETGEVVMELVEQVVTKAMKQSLDSKFQMELF